MSVPLALAAPAAAASLAYLNARTQFTYDFNIISSVIGGTTWTRILEKRDQVSQFYTLEKRAKAKKTANHPFLVYQGQSWTYNEVYQMSLKYGTWLKAAYKVAPGEIVAMDFMNSPQFVFMWMGIWSLGAFPAFINYNLTGKPLLHCLKTSTSRILFVDESIKTKITPEVAESLSSPEFRSGKQAMEVVIFDSETESQILSTEAVRQPDSCRSGLQSAKMSSLIYTSGTTGLPKPGIVSWNKGIVGAHIVRRWIGIKQADRFYTCMPLYHSSASVLGFCTCLASACTLVLGRKFSTSTFWPEVRSSNATIIQYVGETCRYLLAAPPTPLDTQNSVRVAFGNGLRPDVWQRFKDRFNIESIAEFYGSTEGPGALWNLSSNDFTRGAIGRTGTLTQTFFHSSFKIVKVDWDTDSPARDPNNNNFCTLVDRNTPGEMLYTLDAADTGRGFQGYLGNPKATESKILHDVFTKGDAWFRSGDILRHDEEGRVWFCDRIGDTFRWKSENVSTAEVSEVLGLHHSVLDANVYGVEIPNHDGRAGCAAIVFDSSGKSESETLRSLANHVTDLLPRFAVPLFLRVATEVKGTTGTNKQQKNELRAESVDPVRIMKGSGADKLFWLRGGTYVPFGDGEWEGLREGRVRL